MIIFHEGLPRSGKSYEAMVERLIPALKAGRPVDAQIDGLNLDRIAEAAELPRDLVGELLQVLTPDQMPEVYKYVRDNALVILDEVQDYWPVKAKLSQDMTKFVTQHGHRGIDIVLMGQNYKDAHVLWRRRIEIKVTFIKLSAVGAESRYSVTTARHKGDDVYATAGTKTGKYDKRFFGTYASHVSGEIQTANYKDRRASVWSSPIIRFGLPAALVAAVFGVIELVNFFDPDRVAHMGKAPAVTAAKQAGPVVVSTAAPVAVVEVKPARVLSPQEARFVDLSAKYRIRLAGFISTPQRVQGVVEWVDGGTRVVERLSLDSLRDLGVAVVITADTVRLGVGEWVDFATMWPIDEGTGRVSQARLDTMRPAVIAEANNGAAVGINGALAPLRREPAAPLTGTTQSTAQGRGKNLPPV